MDFSWAPEQITFAEEVGAFASGLNDDLVQRDLAGDFSRDLWRRCADFGILGMLVPEAYSGTPERDVLTVVRAMEHFGYACRDNGLALALGAQMWAVQAPLVRFGTDAQKERWLPRMTAGELIGVHGLTEPASGSDVFSLQTTAQPCDDGYVLHGAKRYITLGPEADLALVFANTQPERGRWGISAFVVEADRAGFHVGEVQAKMGLRTVPFGELRFDDCYVPATHRLGPEGAGVGISHASLELERCCIFAGHLGAMRRQLDRAVRYAQERTQFGQAIGKFQAVSHRLAEMRLRIETTRLLLYHAAWRHQQGLPSSMETTLLKLHVTEAFVASSLDAIRVHGGQGYLTENEVERDLRDAVGGVIYAGTSDMQRNIVARLLGL